MRQLSASGSLMNRLFFAARRTRRLRTSCGRTGEAYQTVVVVRGDWGYADHGNRGRRDPRIRDACPIVAGLTVVRRSTISRESPGILRSRNHRESAGLPGGADVRLPVLDASDTLRKLKDVSRLATSISRLASSISNDSWWFSTRVASRTSGCLSAQAPQARSPSGRVIVAR